MPAKPAQSKIIDGGCRAKTARTAAIVASNARIKSVLNWQPQHDDLPAIVKQALDWERRLHNRKLAG